MTQSNKMEKKHPRSCNTGGATYNVGGGVDTIHLTYYGTTSEERLVKVALAKAYVGDDPQSTVIEAGGTSYAVRPTGMGRFAFALYNPYLVVKLSKSAMNDFPCAQVQIKSEGLFKYGLERCLKFAQDTVVYFTNGSIEKTCLSRLDIYNDMATDFDFAQLSRRNFISQSRTLNTYFDGIRFTGVVSGSGGDVSFRMYDKVREAKKMGKLYWLEHYKAVSLPIYRCEFQLKGAALRDLSIDINNFKEKLSSLWSYLSNKWFRIVEQSNTDTVNSRWSITSFWSSVQSLAIDSPTITRFRKTRTSSSVSANIKRAISAIASFSVGGSYRDFSDVLLEFVGMSQAYFQTEEASTLFEYYNKKRRQHAAQDGLKLGFVPVPHSSFSIYQSLRAKELQHEIPF